MPGIDHNLPTHGFGNLRQSDTQFLPVSIRGNIDDFRSGVVLLTCEHDAYVMFIVSKLGMPRGDAVEAYIREAAGAAAYIGAEHPVLLPEFYHILEECKNVMFFL